MYSTHETIAIEPEREDYERRQDDDRQTKQKMELIRSKLKTHARKVKNLHEIIVMYAITF
jgi:hypothetical protein